MRAVSGEMDSILPEQSDNGDFDRPYRVGLLPLLKGLVGIMRTHPIFLYQLVVFARFPSLPSAGLVLLGGIANHLAVNIVIMSTVLRDRHRMIYGCLDRLRGFTFQRYSAREFLDESVHHDIDQWYVRRLLATFGMTRARLDDLVHIYVATSPVASAAQLSCYSDPLYLTSRIVIPDPPEDTRGLRRFFVLHEIGHTQLGFITRTASVTLWIWPYLFFLAWIAVTAVWSTTTLLIGAAYGFAMVVWWEEWKRNVSSLRLNSEIVADCFALGYLSRDELSSLARNRKLSLLLDRDLSELHNATRLAWLRENIDLMLRGDDDAMLERSFVAAPEPGWGILGSVAGLIVIVGFCGAPPEARTFWWALALVGVLLIVFLVVSLVASVREAAIEKRLSTAQSVPLHHERA